MDHPARIIERFAIDRQPRMLGLAEHAHQLVDGDAVVDGNDVGARHHDVLDRELAEAEDADEHAAFLHAQRAALAPRQGVLDQFAEIGLLAETELLQQAIEPGCLLVRLASARRTGTSSSAVGVIAHVPGLLAASSARKDRQSRATQARFARSFHDRRRRPACDP